MDEELIRTNKANWIFRILFFLALFLIIVLIIRLIKLRRENKDYYKRLEEVRKEQEDLKKMFMNSGNFRNYQGSSDMFEQMRSTGPNTRNDSNNLGNSDE